MEKQKYATPFVIAISVFSSSMIFLWVSHSDEMTSSIAWLGAGYAIICLSFLIFQIVAFVRAHVVYDEDVESIKLKVFEIEDAETKRLKKYL